MTKMLFHGAYTINLTYRSEQSRLSLSHTHETYEIYYFHQGDCKFQIGGNEFVLLPGDLLLLDGTTLHTVISEANRPYLRSVIHFRPEFVSNLINYNILKDTILPFRGPLLEHFRLNEQQQSEIEAILERMHQFMLSGLPLSRERYALTFIDLLSYISAHYHTLYRPVPSSPPEKIRHVQQIITYLNKNYKEELHMDRLQRELHLSKTYMAALFKEVTGFTMFQHLRQVRLNNAKLLFINNPTLSVADVCFAVGYKHPSHFSRLFKETFELSPEDYRKSPTETRTT